MPGTKILEQIEIVLKHNQEEKLLPVYIDVYDNSLSRKWLGALEHLVKNNYHLEKNYCFFGFDKSERNLEYLCDQINKTFAAINNSDLDYFIDDFFSVENTVFDGPVGEGLPGMKINHDKFNVLHGYFEDLQGTSANISDHYKRADATTRWHIRQLNLLCHEAESFILSRRKAIVSPEWKRPSQLMCWLNAPRFTLDENDHELFGIDALSKDLGGVYVGVNKAVGKHHWEVFNHEGADSVIDDLVTKTLNSQTEAAGDFDIEWAQETKGFKFWKEQIDEFTSWLIKNGFDPDDKSLTLGHPKVAQVNLAKTFGSTNFNDVWEVLDNFQDVYSITVNEKTAIYNYHWKDRDFAQRQINIIGE